MSIGLIATTSKLCPRPKRRNMRQDIVPCAAKASAACRIARPSYRNDAIRDWVFDKMEANRPASSQRLTTSRSSATTTLGGDAWSSRILLEEMASRLGVVGAARSRNSKPRLAPSSMFFTAIGSMNYISRHMEEKYGTPWVEYQLLWTLQDRRVAAQDRQSLRRDDQGKRREGHREYQALCGAVIANIAASRGRRSSVCRRPASAPCHRAYEDSAWNRRPATSLPQRRLSAHDSLCEGGTLIYDDVTGYEFEKFVEKVQPDLVGSGIKENTSSRNGRSFPSDAQLGLFGPITATTASRSSRATWTWRSTRGLENDQGPLGRLIR